MDGSSTDEDPFTWDYDPDGNRGFFARLRPRNLPARVNFHHAIRYIRSEGALHHDQFAVAEKDDGGRYVGYFGLSMHQSPRRRSAWVFGSDPDKADLLLSAPARAEEDTGVHPAHGEFFQDSHFATLMVRAKGQSEGLEIFLDNALPVKMNGCMINANGSVLIGVFLYQLEFTDLNQTEHLDQINTQRQERGQRPLEYPATLTPTPTTDSQLIQDKFFVMRTVFGGSQGSVSFGLRRYGGPPVAAKRVLARTHSPRYECLMREIKMLSRFRDVRLHFTSLKLCSC